MTRPDPGPAPASERSRAQPRPDGSPAPRRRSWHLFFRAKTVLGIALIEFLLLGLLVGSSLNFLAQAHQDGLAARANDVTTNFAVLARDAVLSEDLASLDSFADGVLANEDLAYLRIILHAVRAAADVVHPIAQAKGYDVRAALDEDLAQGRAIGPAAPAPGVGQSAWPCRRHRRADRKPDPIPPCRTPSFDKGTDDKAALPVLVMDDVPTNTAIAKAMLKKAGYAVLTTAPRRWKRSALAPSAACSWTWTCP